MSRRSRKGYYVDGEFIVAGSDADRQVRTALEPDTPSRAALKYASEQLQEIGAALLTLRADRFAALPLPDTLRQALLDAKRITSFGAKRRQLQLIGKLMRTLDAVALDAVHAAQRAEQGESAQEIAMLHRAEQWRDAIIQDDEQLERWIAEYPDTDVQRLRALIRQARKDAQRGNPGQVRRQGRAYREIFKIVRARLGDRAGLKDF